MSEPIWIVAYLGVWALGVIFGALSKIRLRKLHPDIHSRIYLSSKFSLNKRHIALLGFCMRSSRWYEISDRRVLIWLKLQRIFIILILFLLMLGLLPKTL